MEGKCFMTQRAGEQNSRTIFFTKAFFIEVQRFGATKDFLLQLERAREISQREETFHLKCNARLKQRERESVRATTNKS